MKALVMVESTPQECYSINILHGPSFWMISEFTSNLVQSAFHTTNRRPKGAHAGSWNHHKQEGKDCYWHSRPSFIIKEQNWDIHSLPWKWQVATPLPYHYPTTQQQPLQNHCYPSDQGSIFLSSTVSYLYNKFGVQRMKTSPYRPQSNGKLERFHSNLKTMLSKCNENRLDWPDAIDLVLHFCRNMPQSRHGFTPHENIVFKTFTMHLVNT